MLQKLLTLLVLLALCVSYTSANYAAAEAAANKNRNLAKQNKIIEQEFLSEKKLEPDVLELPSGVLYKFIKHGTGEVHPKVNDKVEVDYVGKTLEGVVFDSTRKPGKDPAELGMQSVIKGWRQVLQKMVIGDQVEAWIPAELAYGLKGSGSKIKPNACLHFDIELLNIMDLKFNYFSNNPDNNDD